MKYNGNIKLNELRNGKHESVAKPARQIGHAMLIFLCLLTV